MAASYPAAVKTFGAITSGVTELEQSLFDDAIAEIEAIETELGANVHGSAGSLHERLKMAMDYDGISSGLIRCFNAATTERLRMRSGATSFKVDSLTKLTYASRGMVTFDIALTVSCYAFVELQLVEANASVSTIPCFACYEHGTGSTSGFSFLVSDGAGNPPAAGQSFILHWWAREQSFSGAGSTGF